MKKTLFVILVLACPSCWAMVEVEDAPFGQLDLFDYGFQPGAALLMEEEGEWGRTCAMGDAGGSFSTRCGEQQ